MTQRTSHWSKTVIKKDNTEGRSNFNTCLVCEWQYSWDTLNESISVNHKVIGLRKTLKCYAVHYSIFKLGNSYIEKKENKKTNKQKIL